MISVPMAEPPMMMYSAGLVEGKDVTALEDEPADHGTQNDDGANDEQHCKDVPPARTARPLRTQPALTESSVVGAVLSGDLGAERAQGFRLGQMSSGQRDHR